MVNPSGTNPIWSSSDSGPPIRIVQVPSLSESSYTSDSILRAMAVGMNPSVRLRLQYARPVTQSASPSGPTLAIFGFSSKWSSSLTHVIQLPLPPKGKAMPPAGRESCLERHELTPGAVESWNMADR